MKPQKTTPKTRSAPSSRQVQQRIVAWQWRLLAAYAVTLLWSLLGFLELLGLYREWRVQGSLNAFPTAALWVSVGVVTAGTLAVVGCHLRLAKLNLLASA